MFRSVSTPTKIYSCQFRIKTITQSVTQSLQGQTSIVWKVRKCILFSDNTHKLYYYSLKLNENETHSNSKGYIMFGAKTLFKDGDIRNIANSAINKREFPNAYAINIKTDEFANTIELVFEDVKAIFDLLAFVRNSEADPLVKRQINAFLDSKSKIPPWDVFIEHQANMDNQLDDSQYQDLIKGSAKQSVSEKKSFVSPNAIYKNLKMHLLADPMKQIIFTGYFWKKGSFTANSWKMRSFRVKENGVIWYYALDDTDDISISNGTFRDHNITRYEDSHSKGRINITSFYIRDGDINNISICGCPKDTTHNPMVSIEISEKPFSSMFNPVIHTFVIPVEIAQGLFFIIQRSLKSTANNIDAFLRERVDRYPWNWVRGGGGADDSSSRSDDSVVSGFVSSRGGGGSRSSLDSFVDANNNNYNNNIHNNNNNNNSNEGDDNQKTSILKQMRIDILIATKNIQEKVQASTLFRGYFWKKGSFVSNWKKRSFEIKDDKKLYYFVFSSNSHNKLGSGYEQSLESAQNTVVRVRNNSTSIDNSVNDFEYESFEDISLDNNGEISKPQSANFTGYAHTDENELDGFKGIIDIDSFYVRDGDPANISKCGCSAAYDSSDPPVALDISSSPFNSLISNISSSHLIVIPVSIAKDFLFIVQANSTPGCNNIDKFLTFDKMNQYPWKLDTNRHDSSLLLTEFSSSNPGSSESSSRPVSSRVHSTNDNHGTANQSNHVHNLLASTLGHNRVQSVRRASTRRASAKNIGSVGAGSNGGEDDDEGVEEFFY